jgi:hypothetical protein
MWHVWRRREINIFWPKVRRKYTKFLTFLKMNFKKLMPLCSTSLV